MTKSEVALVLVKCAAFDQRTIAEGDVEAWHEIVGHVDVADGLAAVTSWYSEHHDRIMPADILKIVFPDPTKDPEFDPWA